uniref:Uncharacterized protein n=1 Tax=Solanum lycopersicum TaxID=4081 RepID=A0A3Q7EDD8_SOLLC
MHSLLLRSASPRDAAGARDDEEEKRVGWIFGVVCISSLFLATGSGKRAGLKGKGGSRKLLGQRNWVWENQMEEWAVGCKQKGPTLP